MGGGLIEYTSMVIGMRSVWLLVLVVYLMAWPETRPADEAEGLSTISQNDSSAHRPTAVAPTTQDAPSRDLRVLSLLFLPLHLDSLLQPRCENRRQHFADLVRFVDLPGNIEFSTRVSDLRRHQGRE